MPDPDPGPLKDLYTRILSHLPEHISDTPDPGLQAEASYLDAEKKKAEIEGTRHDILGRVEYAGKTFWLVATWLGFVATVVLLQGFKPLSFSLDKNIVLALIGATTTGIVGLFLVVARYLFQRK